MVPQHVLPADLIPPPVHHVYDDAFLLDTGPLVLPWADLFDAADPAMKSFEDFFRFGPNNELRGPQTGAISRAVLRHEISSCEVCYSWNIVNAWKRRDASLSLRACTPSSQAVSLRKPISIASIAMPCMGTFFVVPLLTWCIRQAVIDDQLADGELHLLRLCPRAWATAEEETIFKTCRRLLASLTYSPPFRQLPHSKRILPRPLERQAETNHSVCP